MTPEDLYLHAVINRHRPSDDRDSSHSLRRRVAALLCGKSETGIASSASVPEADLSRHQPEPMREHSSASGRPACPPIFRNWKYSDHLESITLSGSHAKSTALRDSDVDLFLSLSPDTPGPIAAIHGSLTDHFLLYLPHTRNVSVRITLEARTGPAWPYDRTRNLALLAAPGGVYPWRVVGASSSNGFTVDLVPGRRRPDSTVHTLWQSRQDTWLQTDIAEQIRYVRSSGLLNEILALKIWRRRNALRFPSFAMELATIHALSPNRPIAESFTSLLRFLAADFPTTRLLDPANSNNVVSDLLTPEEKSRIAGAAEMSLRAVSWPEIL